MLARGHPGVRGPGGRAQRAPGLAVVAALGLGVLAVGCLAGCSTSATYVTSTAQQMYFKLPSSWKIYKEATLTKLGLLGDSPPPFFVLATAESQARAVKAFNDAFTPTASPWAVAEVRPLDSQEQEQLSLGSLSDVIVPVDTISSEGGSVQALLQPQLLVFGALHGTRVAYSVQDQRSGAYIDFEQAAVVNSPTDKLWVIAAGCSDTCFETHKPVINRIMESWTVRDKGTS